MKRESATTLSVRTAKEAENEAGPFRVSFLLGGEGVASTLFAAPDERENGGYFLMLAGPPAELTNARKAALIRREVTLVLDRSGSMEGEKIVQLKAAAKQTLSALGANEYFNLVVYHHDVQLFSPTPVLRTAANLRKALAFVDAITADGGTNIEAALRSAMQMPTVEGTLPVVLFVTDGVPSRGITSEAELRKIAVTQNVHRRRLFAFGVGADLNAPLLDKISTENRGVPTYVLPGETAEVKMTQTFRKLAGPVLSDVKLDVLGTNGQVELGRVVDVLPAQLPDLFEGDQFVILGRYNEDRPMTVRISGNFSGKPTSFTQKFEMDRKTTQNSFVPRLWASRKIGAMGDELRQLGADRALVATSSENPAVKELVGSILRLSTQFGIMSEYTAFLAMEGTDLTKRDANLARAMTAFQNLPMMVRTGPEAVRQALNTQAQMSQVTLNRGNQFIAVNQTQTDILSIQLANDLTFFKKDGKWVDTRLLVDGKAVRAARTVKMGTPEFVKLMEELTSQGRGGFATLRGEAIVLFHGEPVLVELQ
jgi:Ca-activated chloride channel family protein